jgi:hypothetical protein
MSDTAPNYGREISKRLLKAVIAVVGLLLTRFVLVRLPMLAHVAPFYISAIFGTDQAVVSPVMLAKVLIDTLIFAVVMFIAIDIGHLVRAASKHLPELGTIIVMATIVVIVAPAYSTYSDVVLPILGDQSLYDWIFLALGVLPLAFLIFLVYRNLDTITDIIFHSSRSAIRAAPVSRSSSSPSCSNCGSTLTPGERFCTQCGTANPAATMTVVRDIYCSECGAKSVGSANHCSSCGKPLVKVPT